MPKCVGAEVDLSIPPHGAPMFPDTDGGKELGIAQRFHHAIGCKKRREGDPPFEAVRELQA